MVHHGKDMCENMEAERDQVPQSLSLKGLLQGPSSYGQQHYLSSHPGGQAFMCGLLDDTIHIQATAEKEGLRRLPSQLISQQRKR